MVPLRIAIIGAGLAGCTLAVLLQKYPAIDVTVFEAEAGPESRSQGGSLDLHDETGLAALKRAGLFEAFQSKARYDGEAFLLADKHFRKYVQFGGATKATSRGRPEIDREALRSLLLENIREGTIKWGHKLQRVDPDNTLHFQDHTETGFDLIVGADGTWSKIRPLLSTVKPAYSGIGAIRLTIDKPEKDFPEIYKLVNHGSFFTFSDAKFFAAQQQGDGSIQLGCMSALPENWIKDAEFDVNDAAAVKDHLHKQFSDWASIYHDMIDAVSDGEPWVRNLYHLPVGHRWPSKGNVTLIGDAAHVFTPFAGEGVNLAMSDAMHLADAIITTSKLNSKTSLAHNIKTFEEDMFVRAQRFSELTFKLMSYKFMTDSDPYNVIEEYVITAVSDGTPWWLMPLARVAVYGYYWYWRRFGGGAASVPVSVKLD
ncbi:hypothetical protein MBLNU457_g2975t1 [Dothideomycetes sp. NU457]